MSRTNAPVNVFDSRQVSRQNDERKADVEDMSSKHPGHEHCQLNPVVLDSDHTMIDTLAEDTDENTKPPTEARVDVVGLSFSENNERRDVHRCFVIRKKRKKDYKVTYRAAGKSETGMKTTLSEEMSVPDGLSVCTSSSHITGMSGGKAVNSTIIGEDVTSRNNTSHIADSVVKLRNGPGGSEIVGMEGGESYGSTIIGKKTVSEGNKQTVERSHLDIDGDPSAALQPLLLKAASGHDGDGGGGVSIKDTTIIINGTGGRSDDTTKSLEEELGDTKHRLDKLEEREDTAVGPELHHKQMQPENMAGMEQELSDTKRRLQDLQDTVGEMKRNQIPAASVQAPFRVFTQAPYGFPIGASNNAPLGPQVAVPLGPGPQTIVIAPPPVRGRAPGPAGKYANVVRLFKW